MMVGVPPRPNCAYPDLCYSHEVFNGNFLQGHAKDTKNSCSVNIAYQNDGCVFGVLLKL